MGKLFTIQQQGLRSPSGFTIVELLIVIVVIAILAAITIVSYNGITQSANESALKVDLKNAVTKLQLAKTDKDVYPENVDDYEHADSTTFTYIRTGSGFCLEASSSSLPEKVFHATQQGGIEEGGCTASTPTAMQAFTPAHCAALATNESKMLTDSRGGTERTYEIAKLADGRCWMLTNLKLGSTTSSMTLTPSDSDVATNFTLPQIATTGAVDDDNPRTYGPIPDDPGTYGYLYNFSAATAGETRTSLPATGGDAAHSICPAGWKLPTGGAAVGVGDFSKLDQAFGGAGVDQGGTPPHLITGWLSSGLFKGVFSGAWATSFTGQAASGYLWTRSPDATSANYAFGAGFTPSAVSPGTGSIPRYFGLSVRCLLD